MFRSPLLYRLTSVALLCLLPAAFLTSFRGLTYSARTRSHPRHAQASRNTTPSRIEAAVATLAGIYRHQTWAQLDALITDRRLADHFQQLMGKWRQEKVNPLRVSLVSIARETAGHYVATVEFSGDPRATADYAILALIASSSGIHVVGTATGLSERTDASAGWRKTISAHFEIFHSPYQLNGRDRRGVADLEYQRSVFARRFHVGLPPLTAYYLYPEQSMMQGMTEGACGTRPENVGCADPLSQPPMIHTSLWPTYHEPIHVYETALEPRPVRRGRQVWYSYAPLFIAEGTAVALEDRSVDPRLSDYCSDLVYRPLDTCARGAITHAQPLDLLSDSGFKKHDAGFGYSLGGDFVKYVILRYGYQTFGRFYYVLAAQPKDRLKDYDAASKRVLHAPFVSVLDAWTRQLCGGAC
ncbi:MAG: hypothetical protein ACR2JC_15770 [Chloroflexota bacterium]|nr:MAG: hypothetical protein DLM70_07975 [Chloroflexota bacterium]